MKITFYTFFSFLNLSLQHKVTCICVLRDLSLPPKWPHPLVEYTGDNRECFIYIDPPTLIHSRLQWPPSSQAGWRKTFRPRSVSPLCGRTARSQSQ